MAELFDSWSSPAFDDGCAVIYILMFMFGCIMHLAKWLIYFFIIVFCFTVKYLANVLLYSLVNIILVLEQC